VSGFTGPTVSSRALINNFFCCSVRALKDPGSLSRVMMTGALLAGVLKRPL